MGFEPFNPNVTVVRRIIACLPCDPAVYPPDVEYFDYGPDRMYTCNSCGQKCWMDEEQDLFNRLEPELYDALCIPCQMAVERLIERLNLPFLKVVHVGEEE